MVYEFPAPTRMLSAVHNVECRTGLLREKADPLTTPDPPLVCNESVVELSNREVERIEDCLGRGGMGGFPIELAEGASSDGPSIGGSIHRMCRISDRVRRAIRAPDRE